MPEQFDIAVSFAGAQRDYVREVVDACKELGVRVFFDEDATAELWGRNVITELRKVYGSVDTRYVVPFLSRDYLAGAYPMDEFRTALRRGLEQEGYILPVMMDDVVFPPEYLDPATVYVPARNRSPAELAALISRRVGVSTVAEAPLVAAPSPAADPVRLPRIAPTAFSAEETLDTALRELRNRFTERGPRLADYGFRCHVRPTPDAVSVLVEDSGGAVCELRVARGVDLLWSGALTVQFGWRRITNSGVNGVARPQWDPESEMAKLAYQDFTGVDAVLTVDEFADRLWGKIIDHLDSVSR